jgi:hypothetical protein
VEPDITDELEDCEKGLREIGKSGILQVFYDNNGICSRAETCTIPCQRKQRAVW